MLFKSFALVPLLTNYYFTVFLGGGGGGSQDSFPREQSKNAREYSCREVFLWRISDTNNKKTQKQTKKPHQFCSMKS